MAITETQKSRTIRARDKNPPAPSKPRAKPGPKPKDRPRTAARFERDERRQDLTYHDWTEVFDYMEDHEDDSQKKVVVYFATRPDTKGGKLFFTQSALDRCLRGEEATIDELLDPQIEQEDFDSEFLRFAEGEEGTLEILEYLKLCDEDEQGRRRSTVQ
ncbi:hypothetical protein B0H14DRAFT_3663793 [Mycena olivaceomarginata]|nr:hypothetical protein B0H14DRAFT_3663793 [Mycena olivaceomarginata]